MKTILSALLFPLACAASAPAPTLTSNPSVSSVIDFDIAAPSPSAGSNSPSALTPVTFPAAASDPALPAPVDEISFPELPVCDESTKLIEDALLKCEDEIHANALKAGSTQKEYEEALIAAKPFGKHLPKALCALIAAYTPLTLEQLFECAIPKQLYDTIYSITSGASKYRKEGVSFCTWSMFDQPPSNTRFVKGMTVQLLNNWQSHGFFVHEHDRLLKCIDCFYRVIRIAPWMNPGDSHSSDCPNLSSTAEYEQIPADPIARKKHYARHVHLYGMSNDQLYQDLSLELQLFAGSYGPAARAKGEHQ